MDGRACACVLVLLASVGCSPLVPNREPPREPARTSLAHNPETLAVASWNLEWFGASDKGPSDEALQRENVRAVIAGVEADIWGVVEVVDAQAFEELTASLPGYAGLLANDARVLGGAKYYSNFSDSEQKVGVLYRSALASLIDARLIITESDYAWGGRPPLQVTMRVTRDQRTEELVIIVVHAKCCDDSTSYARRKDAASALKAYLDASLPTQRVWVVGDFNDDLERSIRAGEVSPYAGFLEDPAHYTFATLALARAHRASMAAHAGLVDHHLLSNEAAALWVPDSTAVLRPDQTVNDYAATTSDHYPVISRYHWPSSAFAPEPQAKAGAAPAGAIINEIGANEPGEDTAGEFIELFNPGATAFDLSGFSLWDASALRHMFPEGSQLAAGSALTVFGASSATPTSATAATPASTGALSLSNSGDTVSLRDASGTVVQSYAYTSSQVNDDGVSLNRNPDGSATGLFVKHASVSQLPSSAGKRSTGAAW
ncbi:MAG: hypothetical protein RL701_7270 [Pseudomonadota bacterium]|jgi:hypothetical protein